MIVDFGFLNQENEEGLGVGLSNQKSTIGNHQSSIKSIEIFH
jgi:hypothetical protein